MSAKILTKRSSVANAIPTAAALSDGELAINVADGKLYFKGVSDQIFSFSNDSIARSIAWANVTSKPTTVAGYGITDAVATSRTFTAGNGLDGGGTLAANRTFTLGTPGSLSGATTNAVTATSHTHAILAASESVFGVAEIATQAETNTGSDNTKIVSPQKLLSWKNTTSGLARFVSSGSWTVPPGVTRVYVSGCGAGGGGGGGKTDGVYRCGGGGGGAGDQIYRWARAVTPGTVINITIGVGGNGATASAGAGATGNNGADGGDTIISVLNMTLSGGSGGRGASLTGDWGSSAGPGNGGASPVCPGSTGQASLSNQSLPTFGGNGGDTIFGIGGRTQVWAWGAAGGNSGGGGGGGAGGQAPLGATTAGSTGGIGGGGIVVIEF